MADIAWTSPRAVVCAETRDLRDSRVVQSAVVRSVPAAALLAGSVFVPAVLLLDGFELTWEELLGAPAGFLLILYFVPWLLAWLPPEMRYGISPTHVRIRRSDYRWRDFTGYFVRPHTLVREYDQVVLRTREGTERTLPLPEGEIRQLAVEAIARNLPQLDPKSSVERHHPLPPSFGWLVYGSLLIWSTAIGASLVSGSFPARLLDGLFALRFTPLLALGPGWLAAAVLWREYNHPRGVCVSAAILINWTSMVMIMMWATIALLEGVPRL